MPDFDDAGNETAVGYLNRAILPEATGLASDSVLLESTPEERHEFHMLDRSTAYCPCGWAVSVENPNLRRIDLVVHEVVERYREHL